MVCPNLFCVVMLHFVLVYQLCGLKMMFSYLCSSLVKTPGVLQPIEMLRPSGAGQPPLQDGVFYNILLLHCVVAHGYSSLLGIAVYHSYDGSHFFQSAIL